MDRHADTAESQYVAGEGKKLFSLSRAQNTLPLVREIVADAVASYSHLLQTQHVLEKIQRCGPVDEIRRLQGEMTASAERVQNFAEELTAIGVELRDPAQGVVDFPALVEGRLVSLCWRPREKRISCWHECGIDCARRRPLRELARRPAAAGS